MESETRRQLLDSVDRLVSDLATLVREHALTVAEEAMRSPVKMRSPMKLRRRRELGDRTKPAEPGTRRSREAFEATKMIVLAALVLNPGLRMAELSRTLGMERSRLILPMRKLMAERRVRARGLGHATTYWAEQ